MATLDPSEEGCLKSWITFCNAMNLWFRLMEPHSFSEFENLKSAKSGESWSSLKFFGKVSIVLVKFRSFRPIICHLGHF